MNESLILADEFLILVNESLILGDESLILVNGVLVWNILFLISCPLDYLLNPKNPTPPKLRFVSPSRKRGGD
ncbi:hypothetical protein PQG02_30570 [Nostoc sp. UHCC 0926]|nr:hypothetical protein PQG02_30570 [Nostoc sp. UHCC 0926]